MKIKIEKAIQLLRLAEELEWQMSDLYMLYYKLYDEDKAFWWEIANEELKHQSLLEAGEEFVKIGKFPEELLEIEKDTLEEVVGVLGKKIEEYKKKAPSKKEAYEYALKMEDSAFEKHYQYVMVVEKSDSKILDIFKRLNAADKDHYERIKKLIEGSVN
ncbi:hypothetical protein [Haliovirga abyssi]|uniref:Rubrerythrin diiron-binding domain-containing protein n=1 Tax=Haliovirga abyssi TaxID=2996794 RepID=A0AAU9D8X0_9FUSO|nr:hypothetical protein [Haliovirga abyssi]BDU49720.1 hypothetical protein HLVA_02890 [Haliovirga abyssi]